MKKWIVMLFIMFIILIVLNFSYAQEITNITKFEKTRGFQEASNAFFEKDITLPSEFEIFAKILLGINESTTVDMSSLIILLALWIIIMLIIKSLLEIIPLFGDGWKSWVGAIIITCLASSTGMVKDAAVWLFDLKRMFGWLEKYSFFFIILNITILIIFAWGTKMLLHRLKQESKKITAEIRGLTS